VRILAIEKMGQSGKRTNIPTFLAQNKEFLTIQKLKAPILGSSQKNTGGSEINRIVSTG
jgi:hypothetical protein